MLNSGYKRVEPVSTNVTSPACTRAIVTAARPSAPAVQLNSRRYTEHIVDPVVRISFSRAMLTSSMTGPHLRSDACFAPKLREIPTGGLDPEHPGDHGTED